MIDLREEMTVRDPETGQAWWAERRPTRAIRARVNRRLLANFLVPEEDLRPLGIPEFLRAVPFRDERVLLSACIIEMTGAAPDWAPQALAPPCVGAALRVTCVDTRDESPAVFVGTRYSNSFLMPMMRFLGLTGFANGLSCDFGERSGVGSVTTPTWELALEPGDPVAAAPRFAPAVFEALLAAGVTSYGSPGADGNCGRAALHKRGHSAFERAAGVRSTLFWYGKRYDGDLRTSHGGEYLWLFDAGEADYA